LCFVQIKVKNKSGDKSVFIWRIKKHLSGF
jgi:hypothetical protein